jgi:hypothetical protein
MDYTEEIIRLAAKKLDLDLEKYDLEQIKMGMSVELEHGSKNADKNLNVTNDEPEATLQITLAHLEEDPEYYTKLLKYVEQDKEEKVEERYKLKGFDNYATELTEDGEGAMATLDAVPGMGAPVLAGRGITGSGDVPSLPAKTGKKKKNKKRVQSFDQFIKK